MTVSMVFTDTKRENMNYLANMINPQNNYQQPNWQGFGQSGGNYTNFMQNHPQFAQRFPNFGQGQQHAQGSAPYPQWQAPQNNFQPPQAMQRQGMNWGGGSPTFDERTGQPRQNAWGG